MKGQVLGALLVTTLVTSVFSAPMGATAGGYPPASGHVNGSVRGGALPDRTFGPAQRAAAIAAAQRDAVKTARSLRLSGGQALRVKDVVRDRDESTHIRYERTYRGLPVVGGDFILHRGPNGRIRGADWDNIVNLGKFSNTGWDDSYHRRTASVSKLRGKTITLKFTGIQKVGSRQTGFLIDDVAVNMV